MKKTKIGERLKSKELWVGVIAQVILIITIFIPEFTNEVKVIIASVLEIATTIGFLNNPADLEKF